MVKLSVIIPVYNEQNRFKKEFKNYYDFLRKQKYKWELIIVNDGSVDKTQTIIKKEIKNKKNVKLISYKNNQGKGYAISQGVKNSNGKYILFCDIDQSVPIETINTFFKFFKKGSDVVIGSRRVEGAKILVHQPKTRELLGRGFTALVNTLIYKGIKDSTCGFKAFENKASRKIFSKITVYDWAFDAEILFICKKKNLKISQAPVAWSDVKGSKVSIKKDVPKSLKGLLKIHLNNILGKYD